MTIEELLKKYKRKYPGVPYERTSIRIKSKKNGKLHSYGDAPAIVYDDGSELWYKEGKVHRENDLPAYIQIGEIEKKEKNGGIMVKYTEKMTSLLLFMMMEQKNIGIMEKSMI